MRALEAGFRLRMEQASWALAEGVRHQTEAWLRRPTSPLTLELKDGHRLDLLLAQPQERRQWVRYAVASAKEVASSLIPEARFEARAAKGGLEALYEGEWLPIRWDQLTAARGWGIGFEGEARLVDAIERHVFSELTRRLATCLRTSGKILARRSFETARMPRAMAEPLERLILDVMNEEARVASGASLLEDFLEKTDLRVKYPGLGRKNGARVQVSWVTEPAAVERKVGAMRRSDEMVLVTPYHLAERLGSEPQALANDFGFAVRQAPAHPLGPLAALAPEMRQAIRDYVQERAFATTARLREREAEDSLAREES